MPTPMFTVRLTQKTQADLREMSKVYGAPNASAFAREVLEVMVSGDLEKIKAFNQRLILKAGEQLTLRLNASLDAITASGKPAQKAKKPAKKGGARHGH